MDANRHPGYIRIGHSIVIRFCVSICWNRFKIYKGYYHRIIDGAAINSRSVFV